MSVNLSIDRTFGSSDAVVGQRCNRNTMDASRELANHRDQCKTSDSRPFLQEDGTTKSVRCTVVLMEAFSRKIIRSLKEGIY